MGKVLLAHLDPERLEDELSRIELVDRGPNTITTRAELVAELRRVRERGVAVNNEELAYGLRSIAVPVWGQGGEVVAAINLAVHRSAASIEDLVDRLSPKMQRAAAGISTLLGYRPS
jgi:IclR family pca regulon transcriptional regulator